MHNRSKDQDLSHSTLPNQTTRPQASLGIGFAITASLLFGSVTPLKKILLHQIEPWMLASLFSIGAGVGLALIYGWRELVVQPMQNRRIRRQDWGWLSAGILTGSILAPVLLIFGLVYSSAAAASLLLNLEGALTALIAWFIFREQFSWRLAAGIVVIILSSMFLSWTNYLEVGVSWGALAVIGACLCWGIDNNLTRQIAERDSLQVATIRSCISGVVSVGIALLMGEAQPTVKAITTVGILGFFTHGLSLLCFVLALRNIGASRTGAYFSLAPFIGALGSIMFLGEQPPPYLLITLALMMLGVWLCITEQMQQN